MSIPTLFGKNFKYNLSIRIQGAVHICIWEKGLISWKEMKKSWESRSRLEKALCCVLWTQEKAAEGGVTAAAEVACWSLEWDICWGGWSTYVSTALSSHKDDNLISLQLKKTLKITQHGKNKTTTYTVLMFRCLEFGCVGGAAGRKRRKKRRRRRWWWFGSSSEVTPSSCFRWVYIYNTNRFSIRSLQLCKNPDPLQLVLLCAGYKTNETFSSDFYIYVFQTAGWAHQSNIIFHALSTFQMYCWLIALA